MMQTQALEKVREERPPLNAKRPALRRARADLARIIARFLRQQAPKIAAQVAELRRIYHKAEVTEAERAAIEAIIARVDFAGWSILVGDVEGTIEGVIKDSAYAALAQVGIDTEARKEVRNIVDERAVAYARERGAEMVGMRVDELGRLIPNPNAFWQITEPTRDYIRASVREAIAEGWSNDRLAAALSEAYGFSSTRAMVIARTETNRAASIGALMGYKASGVVDAKKWLTAEDDLVSEECQANGVAGPAGDGVLPLDADYPSGDEAPPVHPNCRCAIAPVVDLKRPTTPTAELGTPIAAPVTVAPATVRPRVGFVGNVSDGFRAIVNGFVDALPQGIARKLGDKDIRFAFGERVTQVRPDLKGKRPRGWREGTWDNADGLFDQQNKWIVAAETYRPMRKRAFVPSPRVRGVLAHETGHGLDKALGYASRDPAFMEAYKADAKPLRAAIKAGESGARRWDYFLQRKEAGPSEAFAEVFAWIANNGAAGSSLFDIRPAFPNLTKYIKALLAGLE